MVARKKYDRAYKARILHEIDKGDNSATHVCKVNGLQLQQVNKWRLSLPSIKPGNFTKHKGPKVKGTDLSVALIGAVEAAQTEQMSITTNDLVDVILRQNPDFLLYQDEETGDPIQIKRVRQWLYRFLDRNGYSDRRPTHVAQMANLDVQEAVDFIEFVNEQASKFHITPDCIANMDQTNCPFDLIPKKTITRRGSQTVTVKKPATTGGSKATVNLCVTANGKRYVYFSYHFIFINFNLLNEI